MGIRRLIDEGEKEITAYCPRCGNEVVKFEANYWLLWVVVICQECDNHFFVGDADVKRRTERGSGCGMPSHEPYCECKGMGGDR
jgi:hypothetical protein